MVAKRTGDLSTLLKQLRAERVREYEEDPDGNVRLVFDDSAFAPAAPAKAKDKPEMPKGPHSAAVIALHGFKHGEPIG